MAKSPEITWSLMHPTDLNIEYMRQVVQNAGRYRVDSFEICGACHGLTGGMEGLVGYEEFPCAYAGIDHQAIEKNRETFREILRLAHSANRPVYYWHREIMIPDGLLRDLPELLDENGEFDLLGDAFEKLLRYKLNCSFEAVPELDGLVLTLTESDYSVIHNSNTEKYPPEKVVEKIVRIFASEHEKRGKHFILRSFGSIARDYEDILAGANLALEDYSFEIETKITPYDFDPFLPVNPFLRKLPHASLGAECDVLGEFLGAGYLPSENVDNIVKYVQSGRNAGVDRYALRLDRIGNSIFNRYEINLYAYARAIDDPAVDAETIRREWADMHYPPSARETFLKLGKAGFSFVEKNNFIDGNVIFHQFPIGYELKMVKAAYIFALFKNQIDLHLGKDVWSILSTKNTPGREAILLEKQAAARIAENALSELAKLTVEPGYEAEYRWREQLWRNARLASRAFLAFTHCVVAYFNDMEAGDKSATQLKIAVREAQNEFKKLAVNPLPEVPRPRFINGLQHDIFRQSDNLDDVYLAPLNIVVALLLEEFDSEFAAREKFAPEAFDRVITGGIYDDWRCGRSMHASHALIHNGLPLRIAGNRVFPNGTITMELNVPQAGGILKIFGTELETGKFIATVAGVRKECEFHQGVWEMSLPPNQTRITLVLEKSGSAYPSFNAVAVI